MHAAAAFLTEAFVSENFAFYGTQLTGVPVNRERWKRGVSLAEAALGEAIGKVYVERHFNADAKEAMDGLVAHLIEAYRASIRELTWMTDETRERALAKLDTFVPKIGYPVRWKDYSDLEVQADDLVGNVRRAHVWEHDRQLAKVGQPIDRDEWYMTPQTVNAYYNPLMNEIVFPAAILQYPFFDAGRDAAANYGGIGAVIGHEIGHGFDDQGSRFDADGSLRDWWTDADRAAFEERTSALIAQYEALVPRGLSESTTSTASSPSARTSATWAGWASRSPRTACTWRSRVKRRVTVLSSTGTPVFSVFCSAGPRSGSRRAATRRRSAS